MPAVRVSQTVSEALTLPSAGALVSQRVAEVLMTYTAPSPTTVTGAGVSQRVVEVLFLDTAPRARVSQRVVELLFSAATTGEGGAPGGGSSTVSFGIVA
jgi:hypothetical protein